MDTVNTLRWSVLVAVTALGVSSGCATTMAGPRGMMNRSAYKNLLKEAQEDYTYPTQDAQPIPASLSAIGEFDGINASARITSAKATPKPTAPTDKRIVVARFHLDADYPRLGMLQGFNYVFLDVGKKHGKGAYRDSAYFVVPEKLPVMHYLRMDRRVDLSQGQHPTPVALMALARGMTYMAACVEGDMCPSGHCALTDAGAEVQ